MSSPTDDADSATTISFSAGKHLLRSVAHYRAARENPVDTPALALGRVVHELVLKEGDGIVEIIGDYRTADNRQIRDEALASGKTPIKSGDLATAREIASSVLEHPTAVKWLTAAHAVEQPYEYTDSTGITVRGRIDAVTRYGGVTVPVDLKTVHDARPDAVFRSVAQQHYDLQGEIYRSLITASAGEKPGPMVIIAVEKCAPYGVAVYQLAHEDILRAGRLKMATMMERAARMCAAAPDEWDGYPLGTAVLTPHTWYLASVEDALDSEE